jgi:RNA polymerase sigma-70 factor (ECF subfamily)
MEKPDPAGNEAAFSTTQWTRVLAARGVSEASRQALSQLCAAYYEPVVAFLARTQGDPAESREVAHEFFAALLQGDSLSNLRREGRFRSYLLGALRHFLSHRHAKERRLKRGAGLTTISLDSGTDTSPGLTVPDPHGLAPDLAFDRAWAVTVLNRALAILRRECEAEGKAEQFERLKPWLTGGTQRGDQAELSRSLGMDINALKSAVHRLKRRFRRLVKQEVASTLSDPASVKDEMQALFSALSS